MITTSSPPLSLPHQDPEVSQAHDPNLHQRIDDQSPQTLTLDSSNVLDPDPEEDFTIVDHEGEEELDESAMSKSGISSSLAPPQLIIPPNSEQESDPRSLTSPTSLSRRSRQRKIGAKKQKAIEKNVQTLIENLKPIPFKPTKNLNFGKHEKLLKRLGLWDFVHIQFDRDVRVDLIAQLIANYEARASYVNGIRVAVNRADLGRAFKLPGKKEKGGGGSSSSQAVYVDPEAVVTEESVEFIGEFVSNWLLLHEDTWILPSEVVEWTMAIKDGHPERVPWAGLLWFMVEKELSQGNKLKECYYASHLQHLIRSQKEELFWEENREEVGAEVKEEDDGGDVEMWQESKGEVNVEVKEEDDRVEVKMEQESEVETMVEGKKEEVDGEIKMAEEPLVEPGEEVKEEKEDGGKVKIGKEPTVEEGVDVEEEEDGGKATTEKFPMVEVGVDVKDDEGGCDMKMGKEPVMEAGVDVTEEVNLGEEPVVGAGVDVKEEVNLGEEPVVEAGVDVKEEVDFGEEPMVEAGGEVKGEEDAGGEMKMGGFDDFLGRRSEGNVMGEEPNVELTLGKERAEEEQYEDLKEGDMMDVEDSDADEQGQWLLDGKNNMGDHFLQRCKTDANRRVDGEEEGKPEEEEGKPEEEEEELDDEEEEEAEDGEFDLMSQGNTLEGNMFTGNLLQGLETTQMPFSLTETHGPSSGPSMYVHNHGSKREIVHEDDMSHKRFRTDGHWNHKSPDFEMCMEEMQQWMGKARMVYQAKEHAFAESNMNQQVLLVELQRRDDLIEHLQKTKREEIQKKDGEIYRLERELYLMGSLLDGYRKAVKETQKAFSEYRQQCQLPEEPVYKDAGPGGLVLSTMELEKRRQKREEEEKMVRMVIEQKVKEFEEDVFGKMEAAMEAHFNDVLKLNERLMASENEFKLLKELSMKPKVLLTSETTVAPESAPVETTVASESAPPESAPVETTVASESAPVETTVASDSAPVETTVASDSAPVETTVAPESAPVETTQTSDVVDM